MKQEITLKQVLEVIKEGEEYTCGSKRVALKNGCFEFWNDGIYCTNIIKVGQNWLFRKVEVDLKDYIQNNKEGKWYD